jgi:hypothetical protein
LIDQTLSGTNDPGLSLQANPGAKLNAFAKLTKNRTSMPTGSHNRLIYLQYEHNLAKKKGRRKDSSDLLQVAVPQVGLEPTTLRLTEVPSPCRVILTADASYSVQNLKSSSIPIAILMKRYGAATAFFSFPNQWRLILICAMLV